MMREARDVAGDLGGEMEITLILADSASAPAVRWHPALEPAAST